jgi:hypothetical protein
MLPLNGSQECHLDTIFNAMNNKLKIFEIFQHGEEKTRFIIYIIVS